MSSTTVEGESGTSVAETVMVEPEVVADTSEATATTATTTEQMTLPMQESAGPTNSEVMVAQVLSRMKKQARQLERTGRMVEQVLGSLKKADAERSRHARQMEQQNKKLLSQIDQMRKQIAKSKKSAAPKTSAAGKARKAKGSGSKRKAKAAAKKR